MNVVEPREREPWRREAASTGGFGGMHPQEKFELLAPKWWILRASLCSTFVFFICVYDNI